MEFFNTKMGHEFFGNTMPRIMKALENIEKQYRRDAGNVCNYKMHTVVLQGNEPLAPVLEAIDGEIMDVNMTPFVVEGVTFREYYIKYIPKTHPHEIF